MEMKTKSFSPGIPVHLYQKALDGNVLFFCVRDRLVYFTIVCNEAKRYGVTIHSLCLMFTHTHGQVKARCFNDFVQFDRSVAMKYAKAFNAAASRSGQVFQKSAGWAHKRGDAKVRENLAYIANNPVVKKLCRRGIDNRWTFLAYGGKKYPFSSPVQLRFSSAALRRSIKLVNETYRRGRHLGYALLDRLFKDLNPTESQQLTDYIIQTYSVIDYSQAASYFGGYDRMIAAFDTLTGAEYDIAEEFNPEPDEAYAEMARSVRRLGYDLVKKQFITASLEEKGQLMHYLLRTTSASRRQIARFLHLPK